MEQGKQGRIVVAWVAALLWGVFPQAASANFDLTGTWTVYYHGALEPSTQQSWALVQTGNSITLRINGGPLGSGTIHPTSGVFSVNFDPSGCGPGFPTNYTAGGQPTADGITIQVYHDEGFGFPCSPIRGLGVGTYCINSPLGPGDECQTPEVPFYGTSLTVIDKSDANKRKWVVKLLDQSVSAPQPDTLEDPRGVLIGSVTRDAELGGARLTIARGSAESSTVSLPAAGWKGLGTPVGSKGWLYRDPHQANGPCKRVLVRAGKIIAVCSGSLLGFTLDETSQGALTPSIRFGRVERSRCTLFSGTAVKRDVPVVGTKSGVFHGAKAAVPVDCTP